MVKGSQGKLALLAGVFLLTGALSGAAGSPAPVQASELRQSASGGWGSWGGWGGWGGNGYPNLGGSDFGTNYNCYANCFDVPDRSVPLGRYPYPGSWTPTFSNIYCCSSNGGVGPASCYVPQGNAGC